MTTQSTTRHNVTTETTWNDEYTMDDTYKMDNNADYSWNKLAKEREQTVYEQEASQVLSDYAKSMQSINEAATQAMDQFFSAMYGSNQTMDKMGWDGGGQVISEERKTSFLKAATAANMYTKDELQRYGVESQLQVARMYAEADMKAYALELYQDELDKAVREAELTGWYISPEASEIMKQQDLADKILNNPSSSAADRARAQKVRSAAYAYYDKLGFTKEAINEKGETMTYPGVKVLAQYELEETKRANQAAERLQQQANDIADQARRDNNANAASSRELQLRQIRATENMQIKMQVVNNYNTYGTKEVNTYTDQGKGTGTYPNFVMNNGAKGVESILDVVEHQGTTYMQGSVNGKIGYYKLQENYNNTGASAWVPASGMYFDRGVGTGRPIVVFGKEPR